MEIFFFRQNEWKRLTAQLLKPEWLFTTALVANRFYKIGGIDTSVEYYDPEPLAPSISQWFPLPSKPLTRSRPSCCVVRNRYIYVVAKSTKPFEVYDVKKEKWQVLDWEIPEELFQTSPLYSMDDDKIFLMGGIGEEKKSCYGVYLDRGRKNSERWVKINQLSFGRLLHGGCFVW